MRKLLVLSMLLMFAALAVAPAQADQPKENACKVLANQLNKVGNQIAAEINKYEAARKTLENTDPRAPGQAYEQAVRRLKQAKVALNKLNLEERRLRLQLRRCRLRH